MVFKISIICSIIFKIAHVSYSNLIKIKLDYGENCLKYLLNDLFLFNRKYQIWFQVSSMKLKTKWQIDKKKKKAC